jgi:hypothetical protein
MHDTLRWHTAASRKHQNNSEISYVSLSNRIYMQESLNVVLRLLLLQYDIDIRAKCSISVSEATAFTRFITRFREGPCEEEMSRESTMDARPSENARSTDFRCYGTAIALVYS